MSGGVLSYVDAKSVEGNEAGEPFSSAWRCIKFDSRSIKVATPYHILSISTSVRARDFTAIRRIFLITCKPVNLASRFAIICRQRN
jgi:hypothetical protein